MRRDKDEVGLNDSARSPILRRSRMFSCRSDKMIFTTIIFLKFKIFLIPENTVILSCYIFALRQSEVCPYVMVSPSPPTSSRRKQGDHTNLLLLLAVQSITPNYSWLLASVVTLKQSNVFNPIQFNSNHNI